MAQQQELSEQQRQDIASIWKLVDRDGDGYIDSSEAPDAVRYLGLNPTDAEVATFMAEADLEDMDGTKVMSREKFEEMIAGSDVIIKHLSVNQEEELKEAFKTFDKNNDGYVTAKELREVMTKMGDAITEEEADNMIKDGDINGDGKVDYAEFAAMMCEKLDW